MRYSRLRVIGLATGLVVSFALFAANPARAVDWSSVPGQEVVLFYPGQASWEWALTQSDHSGNEKFREGKKCRECHRGEERDIGNLIVSGKKVEPSPIAGKAGSIALNVKAATEGDQLLFRLEWPASDPVGPKMDPDHEVKVTVIVDDGGVAEATRAGCWGSCHDDAIGMASAAPGAEVTKYLAKSRSKMSRQGGGDSVKSDAEIQELLGQDVFLEFWQARLNRGAPAMAADGYILDKRHVNATPTVTAAGGLEGGAWTVVLSRALQPGGPGHKAIAAGKAYTVGFAIHDGYSAHRFHYVSLGNSLAIGQGEADIVAVQK